MFTPKSFVAGYLETRQLVVTIGKRRIITDNACLFQDYFRINAKGRALNCSLVLIYPHFRSGLKTGSSTLWLTAGQAKKAVQAT